MRKSSLGRKLTLILGSFIIAALILIFYFQAPPLAVLMGGLFAISITIITHLLFHR